MPKATSNKVKIQGQVTGFDKRPIEGADIVVVDETFKAVAQTYSDDRGHYTLEVDPKTYTALFSTIDYKTKNLEYWAWNVPAEKDLRINPRIGGLELYAVNTFMPQGAPPSLFIYFRPMSLTRINAYGEPAKKSGKDIEFYDVAPELQKEDIEITVDSAKLKIIDVFRIKEQTANDQAMAAYMVQCVFEAGISSTDYITIEITITDTKTDERGSACVFWKRD
jgi:hypothetical protein